MTNNEIIVGSLVCLSKDSKVPGALTAVKLRAELELSYGEMLGIVLESNDTHVFVLFSNGDRKYIHKTFLKIVENQ